MPPLGHGGIAPGEKATVGRVTPLVKGTVEFYINSKYHLFTWVETLARPHKHTWELNQAAAGN